MLSVLALCLSEALRYPRIARNAYICHPTLLLRATFSRLLARGGVERKAVLNDARKLYPGTKLHAFLLYLSEKPTTDAPIRERVCALIRKQKVESRSRLFWIVSSCPKSAVVNDDWLLYEYRTGKLVGFPRTAVSTESEKSPTGRSSRPAMPRGPRLASILEEKSPLLVEEHKIVSAAEDSPNRFEYDRRIGDAILAKRRIWRAVDMTDDSVTRINEAIAPLGYELVLNAAAYPGHGQPIYDLVCNVEDPRPCVANLQNMRNFRMNERKTSFVFIASQLREEGTPYVLIRDGRVIEWNDGRYAHGSPILVGDSLMAVERTRIGPGKTPHNALYRFRVLKNAENVFEFKAREGHVSQAVKRFFCWDGSWVLEYENHVVRDGNDVGQAKGYDAVFDYWMIAGEPFYFFVRGGKTRMVYRDRVLPQVYEDMIHYKCCEPAHFNVRGNQENMVWFHARRDGHWYYVEAGVYGRGKRKHVEGGSRSEASHPPTQLWRSPQTDSREAQR